jgi:hypothetical protein
MSGNSLMIPMDLHSPGSLLRRGYGSCPALSGESYDTGWSHPLPPRQKHITRCPEQLCIAVIA